jgi:hypothetical protein
MPIKGKAKEVKGKAKEVKGKATDKVLQKTKYKAEQELRAHRARKMGFERAGSDEDINELLDKDPNLKDKIVAAAVPVGKVVGKVGVGAVKSVKPVTLAHAVLEEGLADSARLLVNDIADEQFNSTVFKGKRDTRIMKRISEIKYNNIKNNLEAIKAVIDKCCSGKKLELDLGDNGAIDAIAESQINEENRKGKVENIGKVKQGTHVADSKFQKARQSTKIPKILKKQSKVGILQGIEEREEGLPEYNSKPADLSRIETILKKILTNPQKQTSLLLTVLEKINRDSNLKDVRKFTKEEREFMKDFNYLYVQTLENIELKLYDVLRLYMGYYQGSRSGGIEILSADRNLNIILDDYIPKLCLLIYNWSGVGISENDMQSALIYQSKKLAAGGAEDAPSIIIPPEVLETRLFMLAGLYRGSKTKKTKKKKKKDQTKKKGQKKKKKTKMR